MTEELSEKMVSWLCTKHSVPVMQQLVITGTKLLHEETLTRSHRKRRRQFIRHLKMAINRMTNE